MVTSTDPKRLTRGDRLAMYFTMTVGAVGIGAVAWSAFARLIEVAPGRDVPVLVPFADETAELPIGPEGALVEVDVSQAVVTVPEPAAATQFALVAEPIVQAAASIAGIALLGLLAWNLARGHAFAGSTVRLIWWGAGVLAVGWFAGTMLTNMTVNGALSAISEYTYDGIRFSASWLPFFAFLALGAIGGAFQIGEKLQRETEGLV
ncbi:hypothetical protein [Agromyces aerolatus]|uniref:hypothetical protein n=1 Tax=Agromyces sp. LY-1074 TaxID=3074080 RepID=UPI0028616D1E|nr:MULTISPECIES: hypothetical protein [unclassified Agromyces]MDR5698471.1 hypothetical protein [Agromyces sp. LY-1074]MDR5704765.1 hypothetical protein [Agromyces sp. LY-1358]